MTHAGEMKFNPSYVNWNCLKIKEVVNRVELCRVEIFFPLSPEYYQMDPENQPTHFMQGTAAEIWGKDTHEVMYTTAADWETND